VLQLYAESLQRFRLAARGHGAAQPPARDRARVERYFDPLPFWYASLRDAPAAGPAGDTPGADAGTRAPCARADRAGSGAPAGAARDAFPLHAITQRPMFMYHAWGSQNAWLRQIADRNWLYLHPDTAAAHGVADGDWIWLASERGRIRVPARVHAGTAPGTVWTWNAIGKHRRAWKLAADAPEFEDGFLLNHLIAESLRDETGTRRANADPVTGQAAWFDLRVRIERDPQPRAGGQRVELRTVA
jgi:anaerobic selenocysteine-containing dehydrogenase